MRLLNSEIVSAVYDTLIADDYYKDKLENNDINSPKDLYDYIADTINDNLSYDLKFSIPIDDYKD